eukprot:scaffold3742_cov17-Tisochrysis_lutea.AAC.1
MACFTRNCLIPHRCVRTFGGHQNSQITVGAAFSPCFRMSVVPADELASEVFPLPEPKAKASLTSCSQDLTAELQGLLRMHEVVCATLFNTFRFLACGSEDQAAYLYDIRQGTVLSRLGRHGSAVTDVSVLTSSTVCKRGKKRKDCATHEGGGMALQSQM